MKDREDRIVRIVENRIVTRKGTCTKEATAIAAKYLQNKICFK